MTADLIDADTGEILSVEDAERRASYICTDLDGAAEQFESAMSTMRRAVENRDDLVLGYRSPGDYISDRFGGRLARLGVDMRRDVVRELTEMGMSTRAIAPVVGASQKTVDRDRRAGESDDSPQTPESADGGEAVADSGQTHRSVTADTGVGVTAPDVQPGSPGRVEPQAPRPAVTGIDGKTYSRPEPKPKPAVVAQSGDDQAVELIETVARNLTVLSQVVHRQRRDAIREAFPVALGRVAPTQTDRFTPEQMRAVADGLHDLADEWETP